MHKVVVFPFISISRGRGGHLVLKFQTTCVKQTLAHIKWIFKFFSPTLLSLLNFLIYFTYFNHHIFVYKIFASNLNILYSFKFLILISLKLKRFKYASLHFRHEILKWNNTRIHEFEENIWYTFHQYNLNDFTTSKLVAHSSLLMFYFIITSFITIILFIK
jgi:hypothetical protein